MGMLKKLCITTALGIMVSGVSYASVVSETIIKLHKPQFLMTFGAMY